MAARKKESEKKHTVFVYGTLRQNGVLHERMNQIGARYEGEAKTAEAYSLFIGPWPYVLEKAPPIPYGPVTGEAYTVDGNGLAVLDRVEGAPHLYYRKEVAVWVEGRREPAKCWLYFLNRKHVAVGHRRLLTGDLMEDDQGRERFFNLRPLVEVTCAHCKERQDERGVECLNIEEDMQGRDVMTFTCGKCGQTSESFRTAR